MEYYLFANSKRNEFLQAQFVYVCRVCCVTVFMSNTIADSISLKLLVLLVAGFLYLRKYHSIGLKGSSNLLVSVFRYAEVNVNLVKKKKLNEYFNANFV